MGIFAPKYCDGMIKVVNCRIEGSYLELRYHRCVFRLSMPKPLDVDDNTSPYLGKLNDE